MGFHIHTQTHAHTFPLTHIWSRFWPLCTCGKCICEIWHCRPFCPSAVWENVRIQTLNEHILQWVSSNNAFLEMIFMFFCLCETGVHHWVCITFPIVWTSRPLLCINRRRVSARERPKTKEKSHWMCKCHIWKSAVWVSGMEECVFPNASYTQKHIHLHCALWLRMHHLFCFCSTARVFQPQTDFSLICTFLCTSFLHYKIKLYILPCYCMKPY